MRKRKKKFVSKYADEAVIFSSTVLKIEEQNTVIKDKLKTVFYCASKRTPEGIMCIAWGKTCFEIGDELDMKGRVKNDVFLVWSLLIKKRANPRERNTNPTFQEIKNKILDLQKGNISR